MSWRSGLIEWTQGQEAFISIVFSWQVQKAYQRAIALRQEGYSVSVGGPAAKLNPEPFSDFIGMDRPALHRHNPQATKTSTGCVHRCSFCAVWRTEGELKELPRWIRRPIICDNNLTACSLAHFDKVIDSMKGLKGVDCNQGLDCRLFTKYHASRLAELDLYCVRFAWDHIGLESDVFRAIERCRDARIPKRKIRVYCLIGYKDTPEDALYRLSTIERAGILPFPMRYQPLDAIKRNSHVGDHWTDRELKRYMRYWSRTRFFRKIPFSEYMP